jgi:hypothetical protein
VHGETVALQPGYRMGASGLVSERPDAAGSWQRAEHELYVDTAAKEGGTGTSAAPFQTLAQAVAAINEMERVHRWADRYVVRVAAGTYGAGADENIEPVNFAIDAEKPPKDFGEGLLIEKGRVAFVGGFAGGGDWKQRGKKTTIIDPGRRSRAFAAPPSYDVALGFDGFAFRNGASVCGGGAIRLYGGISFLGGVGRAELTLNDCLFENNRCWFAGGAVHAGGNCLAFSATDCDLRNNEAGQGGAAFVVSPLYGERLAKQLRIGSCEFDCNRAAQAGGALWTTSTHAGAVVEATIFGHNTASVAPRPRGWTVDLRGGGGVFLLFRPELPADGSNADLVPWPFGYQTSFGGQRLMQQTEVMAFRDCRFYGNEGEAGSVIQAQPAFSQAERVFSWMPSWVFENCRVDRSNWDDFRSRAHRRPGTEVFEPPREVQ